MTRGEFLGGCLVALLITCSPGLAGVVVTALTGPDRLDAPTTTRGSVSGEGTEPREASPWVAPRPRVDAREASRSRLGTPKAAASSGTLTTVTAYCETGNRTASGVWPSEGMAAGKWPFGTRLRVEGVGVVTVTDRYGWGTQLDIYMDSCAKAREFGRRHLHVAVVS